MDRSPIQIGNTERGERILDLTEILDLFEAQEGIVEHIIGKTGNGKTYEGTRRAIDDLMHGEVVYTTWELILPEVFDQRYSGPHLFFNFIFGKKNFYKFDIKKNWHYVDIDREDLIPFIENITDAKLYMDEGQDVFDSRGGLDKSARKTITRSRHMRKTLVIISQRAQAVDVNARANVSWFFKCIKTRAWFWPFKIYFKIYRTDEMDDQNYPVWEERLPNGEMWKAPVWRSHFADTKIFDSYNSWYLRKGKAKSQEIHLEAYKLTRREMFANFLDTFRYGRPAVMNSSQPSPYIQTLSTGLRKRGENGVELEHEQRKDEIPQGQNRNVVSHKESQKRPNERKMDIERSRDLQHKEA